MTLVAVIVLCVNLYHSSAAVVRTFYIFYYNTVLHCIHRCSCFFISFCYHWFLLHDAMKALYVGHWHGIFCYNSVGVFLGFCHYHSQASGRPLVSWEGCLHQDQVDMMGFSGLYCIYWAVNYRTCKSSICYGHFACPFIWISHQNKWTYLLLAC